MRNVWLLLVVVVVSFGPVAMSETEDLGHIFKGIEKANHDIGKIKGDVKADSCANARPENGRLPQPPAPLVSSDSDKPFEFNPRIRCTKAIAPSGHPMSCECPTDFNYVAETGKCLWKNAK